MCCMLYQATRETLKRHITEFGELLRKENEVGLVIDGQVCWWQVCWRQVCWRTGMLMAGVLVSSTNLAHS